MVTDKTTTYCLQQMVNKEILLTIIVQNRFNYTYVLFALLNYDICLKYFCLSINLRDICFFEIASVNSVNILDRHSCVQGYNWNYIVNF